MGENLVIVGGMQTKSDGSGDFQTCSNHMPAEIYSLVTQNYTGQFDAEGAKRLAPVPSQVYSNIGGTSKGGAYIKTPKVWSDLYLQYVMDPTLQRPSYTPGYTLANGTNMGNGTTGGNGGDNGGGGGSNKGALIGGIVGGVVGFLLIVTAIVIFCIVRRNRRRQAALNRQSGQTELPGYDHEVKHDYAPPYQVTEGGMMQYHPHHQTEPAELAVPPPPSEMGASSTRVMTPTPTTPDVAGGFIGGDRGNSPSSPQHEYGHGGNSPQHEFSHDEQNGGGQPSPGWSYNQHVPHHQHHRSISPQSGETAPSSAFYYDHNNRVSSISPEPHY